MTNQNVDKPASPLPEDGDDDVGPDELDDGTWLVTCLDQQIALFFIPLTEALGLASGQKIATYRPLGVDESDLLRHSGIDIAFQSLDPARPYAILQNSADFYTSRELNLSNKCALSSSLSIHQVESDFADRSGIATAAAAARVASGYKFEPDEVTISAASAREALIVEGAGQVTVVEAAVPLRLLGNIGDIDLIPFEAQPFDGEEGADPSTWRFTGDLSSVTSFELLTQRAQAALDIAISDIRTLQKAYHSVTRHPITLVTRERLPFVLPTTIRRLGDTGRGPDYVAVIK